MSIYTRTGDKGETSLYGGKRVLKCNELVDVYGSIDELNCWIGLISSQFTVHRSQKFLQEIQRDLFTIGSTLAGWKGDLSDIGRRVGEMEKQIDVWEKELPALTNFILPGGSTDASRVHLARAVCRRVERQIVGLRKRPSPEVMLTQDQFDEIIMYVNRLSDLFFMLARFINNQESIEEVTWSSIPRQKKK